MDPVETPALEPEATAPVVEPVEPPEGTPEPTPEDKRLKDARNEAKNLRERAKAAEAERDALKEASMTEAEKTAKRLEEAQAAVPALLKRAVAAEAGLPPELAGRLVGDTEDELLADAESLKALLAPAGAPPVDDPPKGWPNAPQGPRGNPKPQGLAEQIAQLQAEGKFQEAGLLKAQLAAQQPPAS